MCWIASATDAIPVWHDEEIAPSLDVVAADWDGATFGSPYTVASGLQAVSPPSVIRTDTHEFLAYLKDTDNNSGSAEDREVMVRVRTIGEAWGADEQLTTDDLSDSAAQIAVDAVGTPLVIWVKRLVPTILPDLTETHVDQLWFAEWDGVNWSTPALAFEAVGIVEPKLIRNEAGKIVVFWVAASAEFSDVYYSVYDSAVAQWGLPQQVTHDQGAETMISVTESGANILAAYVKRRIDLISDPNGVPQVGLSDIYLMEHIPAKDLFVLAQDFSFDPSPPERGADATVCADIRLSGDFIAEDVLVEFYDGDPNDTGVLIGSDTVPLLLPGEAQPACVTWNVPDDGQTHQLFAVVDPNNAIPETDDVGNNVASTSVFAPDLTVSVPLATGYPSLDTVLVGCTVRNVGDAVAGPSSLEIHKDSELGDLLYAAGVPSLDPGASSAVQFAWDTSGEAEGVYTLASIVDVAGQVNESNESNNAAAAPIPVRGDLQAEQWSATYGSNQAELVVRNVGAKPSQATVVRAIHEAQTLGEAALGALNAGESADVVIPIAGPVPPGVLELAANPDSVGSDEVTLLNNTAIITVPATLIQTEPLADGSLPKTQNNLILCIFDGPITLPGSGNPLVIKDMTNGCVDVSANFTYSIDPDDPNGATLEARETDPNDPNNHDVLPDLTWYQVESAPGWTAVQPFQFEVCTLVGDCNPGGRVTTADYSCVKAALGQRDDVREDLNGSTRVTTADYSVVKGTLGTRAPTKPSLCP